MNQLSNEQDIWLCLKCLQDYTVVFDGDEVVSRSKCGCDNRLRNIDGALKEIERQFAHNGQGSGDKRVSEY